MVVKQNNNITTGLGYLGMVLEKYQPYQRMAVKQKLQHNGLDYLVMVLEQDTSHAASLEYIRMVLEYNTNQASESRLYIYWHGFRTK
jgi:hypothetical protein